MRIIRIDKRVGNKYGSCRYKAYVDLQNDVTKYSNEFEETGTVEYNKRFKNGIFTIQQLYDAVNISMYKNHIRKLDKEWHKHIWKNNIEIKKKIATEKYHSIKTYISTLYKNIIKWFKISCYSLRLIINIEIKKAA
jgi:hypothetical protein